MNCDIAVVGGGLIGLTCAWRLAQAGAEIAVFERGQPGQEASWAAAGMLAPQCEAAHYPQTDDPELRRYLAAGFELGVRSRNMYPALAAELLKEYGADIELSLAGSEANDWRTPGILYLVKDNDMAAARALAVQQVQGHAVLAVADAGIDLGPVLPHELPPALLQAPGHALWLPQEGQVDVRKLLRAVLWAAMQSGVKIYPCEPVQVFDIRAGRVVGLRTPQYAVKCNQVLLAAGAWSGRAGGLPAACAPPVRPVAGVILSLHQRPGRFPCTIYSYGTYLVPRRDGRLLLGSTMEEVGFHKRVRIESVQQLLRGATELIPSLADCAIDAQWAGLRPGSPDGLPILGRTAVDNLYVATGHFRNGILLAPVTAAMMTDCILHDTEIPPAFGVERFSQESKSEK